MPVLLPLQPCVAHAIPRPSLIPRAHGSADPRLFQWHGSPWNFALDGAIHQVNESNTADPAKWKGPSKFLPESAFPPAVAPTYAVTKGADLTWVPMLFEHSLELSYSRSDYGTGYYIYHVFQPDLPTSRPVEPWTLATPVDAAAVATLQAAGSDLVSPGDCSHVASGTAPLSPGDHELLTLSAEPGQLGSVRFIKLTAPATAAAALGRARLQITFDGRAAPSVDAPIAMLHGCGILQESKHASSTQDQTLVQAYPVSVRFRGVGSARQVQLAAFFPMPFVKTARLVLSVDAASASPGAEVSSSAGMQALAPNLHSTAMCKRRPTQPHLSPLSLQSRRLSPAVTRTDFHATYTDTPSPTAGVDVAMLDTKGIEGSDDWSGHLVGTVVTFSHRGELHTLEGDPRFFLDDSKTPQVQGTGTEEWGGGGDYWQGGEISSLPLVGHPTGVGGGQVRLSQPSTRRQCQ